MTNDAPPSPAAPARVVELDQVALYVEEHGAGQPLLLLHGFGGCGQNWQPFVPQLAPHYRLIIVDLRGHGRSTNPQNTFTHQAAALDVVRLLEKLGVARCAAMGMSSGAMTLLHMTSRHPACIDAMVLISATTHFPEQAKAIMRRASLATMPPPVRAMYRACAQRGDEQIDQLLAQFKALAGNDEDMNFTPQDLSRITARTLIVHGDRDAFFPVDIANQLHRAIPDCALWMIQGGEHVPIYDPGVPFVTTALQFLKGPGSDGPSAIVRC